MSTYILGHGVFVAQVFQQLVQHDIAGTVALFMEFSVPIGSSRGSSLRALLWRALSHCCSRDFTLRGEDEK